MKNHLPNHSFQAYHPLDRSKNLTTKTHILNKCKKNQQSFINMNRSMAQKPSTPVKITKKFSFQIKNIQKNNNPITGMPKKEAIQKRVQKSKSTNVISEGLPSGKVKKITRKVPTIKADRQLKLFQWRMSTHYPLVKILCTGSKYVTGKNSNEQFVQLQLQIKQEEDIKFNLSEIQQFSLLNSLYIIEQSLVSFQRLYNKFGYFEPSAKMIFITNYHQCKIWANENIWQNYPNPPKFVLKQHKKVEYFYKRVIKMFGKYFKVETETQYQQEYGKRSVNLVDKLIYELERKNDFIEGMRFIKEFLSAYSLKLNNRFIYPIEVSDTRSRIFSKLEKSQPTKGNSVLEIHVKQEDPKNVQTKEIISKKQQIPTKQEEVDQQSKNIKTLKNSYHKCSKQVLESNVKTIIIERKSQQKEAEIPLKKKSQISICSKQTIVQKKSRFSMYDQKQSNQPFNPINSRHLPNFTQQDFNEQQDEIIKNQDKVYIENLQNSNEANGQPETLCEIKDQEEYEDIVRGEIEKNIRERNGWLQNTQLLFDTDDCAKSYQDSQPSVKIKIRQRNLSKLNRIKKSIAHSIND